MSWDVSTVIGQNGRAREHREAREKHVTLKPTHQHTCMPESTPESNTHDVYKAIVENRYVGWLTLTQTHLHKILPQIPSGSKRRARVTNVPVSNRVNDFERRAVLSSKHRRLATKSLYRITPAQCTAAEGWKSQFSIPWLK